MLVGVFRGAGARLQASLKVASAGDATLSVDLGKDRGSRRIWLQETLGLRAKPSSPVWQISREVRPRGKTLLPGRETSPHPKSNLQVETNLKPPLPSPFPIGGERISPSPYLEQRNPDNLATCHPVVRPWGSELEALALT